MISSMLEPASRFSKTVATGIRVSLNTHAPLRLSGTLSTAGHCDQSRVAMFVPSFHRSVLPRFGGGVTRAQAWGRNFPIRQGFLRRGGESRNLPFLEQEETAPGAPADAGTSHHHRRYAQRASLFSEYQQALSSSICSDCNQRRHGPDSLEHAH